MQDTRDRREVELQAPEAPPDFVPEPELEIDPEDLQPRAWVRPERSRVLWAVGILLALVLMAVIPPLISVNRFQRQIARSVSASLGRPVHMSAVKLSLLPNPGFTLENFVVGEDPEFGAEPVIQARSVHVTLRVWSLWRRRVEFSRISLDEPSVNLVHRADGRWNIESILLQAAKIEAAPTAQTKAGEAPRFPYIEATGARVNVKMGLEKMPLALTEADFALWLPEPQQWRLRLEGKPARTDTAATDTGIWRIQGTLGKAASIRDVPIDVTAEWRNAPLGGVSWVVAGRDAGLRGDMTLTASIKGTAGENAVTSRLEVSALRRADFVPPRTLDIDVTCKGQALGVFHRLSAVTCGWPSEGLGSKTATGLALSEETVELFPPKPGPVVATVRGVSAETGLDALRLVSARVSADVTAGGIISGGFACCGKAPAAAAFTVEKARLAVGDGKPFIDGDDVESELAGNVLTVKPFALDLGAAQPATLEADFDRDGYGVHLSGPLLRSRLMLLGQALPQLGDGLDEILPPAHQPEVPIRVDIVAKRSWVGPQTWSPAEVEKPRGRKRLKR